MAIQKTTATIKTIKELSPTVKHFVLDLHTPEFDFKAGQFVNLSIREGDEILRKPYSIASNPNGEDTQIELCIKLVTNGKVTTTLWNKKEGDEVEIQGPLGIFALRKKKEKLVFIGTGTGIAPLRSMILDELDKQNELLESDIEEGVISSPPITLIFGVRNENELLYKEEFEKLEENNPNFKFIPVISRPTENWIGRQGHVQDNFDQIDTMNSEVYICGLPLMFESAKEKLLSLGISDTDIYHEVFR